MVSSLVVHTCGDCHKPVDYESSTLTAHLQKNKKAGRSYCNHCSLSLPNICNFSWGKRKTKGCCHCFHWCRGVCRCEIRYARRLVDNQPKRSDPPPTPSTICADCEENLPKTSFSHSAWKKRCQGAARCHGCMEKCLEGTYDISK